MRQNKLETVSVKHRTVSLLLALAVVLTSFTFGITTAVNAATTLYLDTSQNTAWNPGDGEKLYATFTDSSGNKVGNTVALAGSGTNLYRVDSPSGAANIQLYLLRSGYTMPDTVPGNKTRVFLKNNANWNPPYAYAWTNGGEMTWPGVQMSKVSSGSNLWWYYDTNHTNVIFGNGTGTSSPQQSADLAITGKNLIFSKYDGGSGWDSAPYYKKYAELSLSPTSSGSNEMYATAGDEVVFSKYPYSGRTFTPKTIYLYNPDWTAASNVKVTWDFSDPYRGTFSMSPATDYGAGYYTAQVPDDAVIQFSYNYATSKQTSVPDSDDINCFNMKNGVNVWCNVDDTKGELTDHVAPVEGSAHNSGSAFWVDAVYYDYYSDAELNNGWLSPIRAGTGHSGSEDNWYPFNRFNELISSVAANDSSWDYPLYFGNFCNNWDAYNESYHSGPYAAKIKGLTRYDYYYNNSNGLKNYNGVNGYHTSVKGLAYDELDDDGNIQYSNGGAMPYFNSSWLNRNNIGTSVKSSFPFRQTDLGNGITEYSFNSEGAADNVFFNWNGREPQTVGYGQGGTYGVDDGLKDFMYQTNSGKGIFPFNNTSATKGARGGNDNLDYGFGIKMNMDFRVPEGGKIGNTPITFTYSGDDDLWVYISEYDESGNLTNSQLVLDLGGNHKKATGKIDFSSMTATADWTVDATKNNYFKGDTMYIEDSYNWGNVCVHSWGGSSGDVDFQCGSTWINGKKYYTAQVDSFKGNTDFLLQKNFGDWTNKSADAKLKGQFGNVTYTDNPSYNAPEQGANGSVYLQNLTPHSETTNWGFEKKRGDTYETLDPSKTYHMTVFYMERGLIESNCEIHFTMTPAQNDVKVQKEIETADVNPGLREDLQQSDFEFRTSENNSVNTSALFTLNGTENYSVGSDGSYYLSHHDVADFDNQYDTGSNLAVTESKPSSGVRYGRTDWEVINNATGERLANGSDTTHPYGNTSTSSFKLENENKNSYITRQVNFVNYPDVNDLTIEKNIVDKDGNALDTPVIDEFGFKLLIDLGDGSGFKARKLNYTVDVGGEETELTTGRDGSFRFSTADRVIFHGIPVGAKFKLTELTASGYKPYKIKVNGREYANFAGTYPFASGQPATIGDNPTEILVTNKQQPVTTTLEAVKYVEQGGGNRALYTNGELFTFKAQGLGETVYNSSGDKTIDIHDMVKTVTKTGNSGEVLFENDPLFLKFTQAGTYAFVLTETGFKSEEGDNTYDEDFALDTTQYLALITVEDDPDNPGALKANPPEYFRHNGSTQIDASSFTDQYKVTVPEFVNPVQKGKVTVNKFDNKKDVEGSKPLDEVEFRLSKVDNTEPASGEDIELVNPIEVDTKKTDVNGVAEFSDLDIFKTEKVNPAQPDSEYKVSGSPQYQMYALEEVSTKDGHTCSRIIQVFRLPILDDHGDPKYEITFDYVNGVIKSPFTSGPGMTPIKVVGLIVVIIACAMLAAYALYFRKKGYAFAFLKKR